MKKIIIFLLLTLTFNSAFSQTIYHIEYSDLKGRDYMALMMHYDEERCTMRIGYHDSNDEYNLVQVNYLTGSFDKNELDDNEYPISLMIPDERETMQGNGRIQLPTFIWVWDDMRSEEEINKPFVAFDLDDPDEEWLSPADFSEKSLSEMDYDYVDLFYWEEEPDFELLLSAVNQSQKQESDSNNFSWGDIVTAFAEGVAEGLAETTEGESPTEQFGTITGYTCNLESENSDEVDDAPDETEEITPPLTNGAAPRMHLMLVANTEVADIGASCQRDFNNVRGEMRGIASVLDIEIKEYAISGANYSKNELIQQLENLNPAPQDIVVFAYTGHGFRFDDQQDFYPMIDLSPDSYQNVLEDNYASMADIFNAIVAKGARLNLVFSDCCNNKIGVNSPLLEGATLFSRSNNNFDTKKLASLFLGNSGNILATSSSPGEYSWCNTSGGFYTISLIQSLREEISLLNKNTPSWDVLINKTIGLAKKRTSETGTVQNGLRYVSVKSIDL